MKDVILMKRSARNLVLKMSLVFVAQEKYLLLLMIILLLLLLCFVTGIDVVIIVINLIEQNSYVANT
jgi:hypothetical protein